jgi:tRNA threonylcarbamoyl adenosine modification protein YeaZ
MKILAIEFASERRSVAVVADGVVRGRAEEIGGRSTRALSLVERALREAAMEREAIDCVAVGLGPGSYTGIRAGISLAQGWQLARGVRLLGLSTVECLAAQAQAEGIHGRVNIFIDAQRSEFYFAAYEVTVESRRIVEPLRLASAEDARAQARAGEVIIWPELAKLFPQGRVLFPDAAMLGRLCAGRTDFVSGDRLEPIYLREAQFVKAPRPRVIPLL